MRSRAPVNMAVLISAAWSLLAATGFAHPFVENAMDVVVGRDRITIDVRIASEEIVLVESAVGRTSTDREWQAAVKRHAQYLQKHLHVRVDGRGFAGGFSEFADDFSIDFGALGEKSGLVGVEIAGLDVDGILGEEFVGFCDHLDHARFYFEMI